jgi:type VI secretion system secreted protein VgrG
MPYTQENRLIAVDTPLGKDVLLLHGFSGREGISQLFRFDLIMLSENPSISFSDIVGQRITVSVRKPDGDLRYINAFISRFAQSGSDARFTYYHAEIVPWLWFLTRWADCRIFQNKTVSDIIKQVFTERGFNDFEDRCEGSFPTREYCVQYRETDFNFVSRLMEQYGIFYFFEHTDARHTLVLANSQQAHQPCPGQSSVPFHETAGPGALPEYEDVITGWRMEQELRPGKYALTDYNFETPSTSLLDTLSTSKEIAQNTNYEVFDYPGIYPNMSEGDQILKVRMEEEEAFVTLAAGNGTCRSLIPGFRFVLSDHYRRDMNRGYIVTEVQHDASLGDSYTSDDDSQVSYSNSFSVIPDDITYRPRRLTPQPIVQGPQTAVVVGPSGSEIYVDKYSRVKVQFFWDRKGKHDDQSSCWIRVAQPWAGKQWGFVAIPRIGQEVIVDFLEGDPDRPIITGRVYNADQMPPYTLPDNQTQTGIKTRSSQGGGASNFNELRFEDKMGQEEFYAHAEKDLTTDVEHDEKRTVQNDRTTTIQHDDTLTVQNNRSATINGTDTETVMKTQSLTVNDSRSATIATSDSMTAGTQVSQTSGTSFSITSGTSMSVTAGVGVDITAAASVSITAGGTLTITAPMVSIEAAMVQIGGVMQAISVVSPTYTPGAGNIL